VSKYLIPNQMLAAYAEHINDYESIQLYLEHKSVSL